MIGLSLKLFSIAIYNFRAQLLKKNKQFAEVKRFVNFQYVAWIKPIKIESVATK